MFNLMLVLLKNSLVMRVSRFIKNEFDYLFDSKSYQFLFFQHKYSKI